MVSEMCLKKKGKLRVVVNYPLLQFFLENLAPMHWAYLMVRAQIGALKVRSGAFRTF